MGKGWVLCGVPAHRGRGSRVPLHPSNTKTICPGTWNWFPLRTGKRTLHSSQSKRPQVASFHNPRITFSEHLLLFFQIPVSSELPWGREGGWPGVGEPPHRPFSLTGSASMTCSPLPKPQITNLRARFWCSALGSKWTAGLQAGERAQVHA